MMRTLTENLTLYHLQRASAVERLGIEIRQASRECATAIARIRLLLVKLKIRRVFTRLRDPISAFSFQLSAFRRKPPMVMDDP
jgi:hypothetical protein